MTTINLSLQKKSAARLVAVQCLYQMAVEGKKRSSDACVAAVKKQLANNKPEQKQILGSSIEPNYPLLLALLSGVEEWEEKIRERVDSAFGKDWKRERMSPVLLAILECATFELFFHKDGKPKVIIDEYTRLTRRFFDDAEVDFVYGALSALHQRYHA
ncbi:MAG: transcription antitermination factor NusB [Alphaproteobacteria bacterium]|nr:transcription antitermination factor NusB [Alphaproteobacteria bacterium]